MPAGPAAPPPAAPRPARQQRIARGQVVVIFAGAMTAVRLPVGRASSTCPGTGPTPAHAARRRRGGAGRGRLPAGQSAAAIDAPAPRPPRTATRIGVSGMTVTPVQDPTEPRRLKVTITGPSTRTSRGSSASRRSRGASRRQGRLRPAGADGQPAELLRGRVLRGSRRPTTNVRSHRATAALERGGASTPAGPWTTRIARSRNNSQLRDRDDTTTSVAGLDELRDLRSEIPNDGTQVIDGIRGPAARTRR